MKANLTFTAVCMALLLSVGLFFAGCSTNPTPTPESDAERLIGKWCLVENSKVDYYLEFTSSSIYLWIYEGFEMPTFENGTIRSENRYWQREETISYSYDEAKQVISAKDAGDIKVKWINDDELELTEDEERGFDGRFYRIKEFENVKESSSSPFENGTHCWEITLEYEGGNSETFYFWGTREQIWGMMPEKTTLSYTIVPYANNEDACEALNK